MFKLNSLFKISFLLALFFSLSACNEDEDIRPSIQFPEMEEEMTIAEIVAGDEEFTTLVSALERVNLTPLFFSSGSFTLFAPTNTAFEALGVNLDEVSDEDLVSILLYHTIRSEVKSTDIMNGQTYASTASNFGPNGSNLSILIQKRNEYIRINNKANVSVANKKASNGVIHVIDEVIMPLDVVGHAVANENFTELVNALGSASGDLVNVLSSDGPFTVFAPINDAFQEISEVVGTLTKDDLSSVLTYHVVSGNVRSTDLSNGMKVKAVNGGDFTINLGSEVSITDANGGKAPVIVTDVQATKGVIHVIEKVILP